jgi:hypothetical protein
LTNLRRTPEAVAIPVPLDGVQYAFCLRHRRGIVVAPQKPETPVPVLVHELVESDASVRQRCSHESIVLRPLRVR